jgi:hypothetical protein
MMRKTLVALALMSAAVIGGKAALADRYPELNAHFFPTKAQFEAHVVNSAGSGSNLSYHNGPVIHSAHVVSIFWGPTWATGGSDNGIATHIVGFFNQFGTTSHYATITQYYDTTGSIQTTSLGNTAWYDTSTPPTNVTDADLQAEVVKYLNSGGVTFDSSAIYEVFLPASSYSSNGSSDSCGGPNLAYCAYHGHFSSGSYSNVKYSSMPYPSCGGCQSAGFTTAQNFDHFSSHETREAVTDEDGNAWYDRRGYEADDKCAWSPAPFVDSSTGYAYQYEWSNKAGGCVQ